MAWLVAPKGLRLRRAAVLLLLATGVAAQDDAEFAFNLFTDIAPIFALFGEQFATQYATESLTWVDHLIFAMVPLGILTMVSGAIRVAGPRMARSFIGRARENRALAEIQLMSSTSGEVCEMFNGKSIIRAMGSPRLAQFLVFPNDYNRLENDFRIFDKVFAKPPEDVNRPTDKSCGIHFVQTAVTTNDGGDRTLMEFTKYHSDSYKLVERYLGRLKRHLGRLKFNKTARPDVESSGSSATKPSGNPAPSYDFLGPPNLQLNLSYDHFEDAWMRKGHEIFLAAIFAVTLQLGLIAIAAVTVFHGPTRASLGSQPKVYGFPCYVAGSFLLSLGMGICSLAIEQSSVEYSWTTEVEKEKPTSSHNESNRDLDVCPRLIWLQQGQTVNDQTFEPYAILAGPKRYVISSSRIEDAERSIGKRSTGSSSDNNSVDPNHVQAHKFGSRRTWGFVSIFGVFAAGSGFIAQFMGLRGLAYPSSIAQLVAIFVMVLVRTIIRRRLGETPGHARALAGHELDFLATRIVYCPKFRNFHRLPHNAPRLLDPQELGRIYQWKVETATKGDTSPFLFLLPEELATSQPTPESTGQGQTEFVDAAENEAALKSPSTLIREKLFLPQQSDPELPPDYTLATSQQLLRVRTRLGHLCGWDSKASDIALSLAQSVELFMNTFPLQPSTKGSDSLDWVVQTRPPATGAGSSAGQHRDSISISLTRPAESGEWEVDLSAIEAVISLWMANIEANIADDEMKAASRGGSKGASIRSRKTTDRRRAKVGSATKYTFCRILGDDFEDGVLKRDISWWVDEPHLLGDQVDTVGGDYRDDESENKSNSDVNWTASRARASDVELIIGFNGSCKKAGRRRTPEDSRRTSEEDSRRTSEEASRRTSEEDSSRTSGEGSRRISEEHRSRELAIVQTGPLPIILAQHLFTSFMWTVAQRLPRDCLRQGFSGNEQDVEIDGPHKFVPYHFTQTWHRPTLRHRQLTKVVRQMEKDGLGSTNDILMCMVPALSSKDLLPNQPMLELLPQVGSGQGWVETARYYNRLLETSIGTAIEENFCYAVVVKTMDFLYLACEPYDKIVRPSQELNYELGIIVKTLASLKFVHVVAQLVPIFDLQQRGEAFRDIFALFGHDEMVACWDMFTARGLDEYDDEHMDVLERKLGFSKGHQEVCRILIQVKSGNPWAPGTSTYFGEGGRGAVMPDIFGWTPLHYASVDEDAGIFEDVLECAEGNSKDRPVHRILDNYQRNPIHVAAFCGNMDALRFMIRRILAVQDKTALSLPGIDRMTPLHLATRAGNYECVDRLIEASHEQSTSDLDIWGREPLHIVTSYAHHKIASLLLERGSTPDRKDEFGKSPLDYLFKDGRGFRDPDGDEEQTGRRSIFLELAKRARPKFQGENGKTFLHYAVEFADEGTIQELLQWSLEIEVQDRNGRTPLHTAILFGRAEIAMRLIDGSFNGRPANPAAKDRRGVTVLMYASEMGLIEVAKLLLEKLKTDTTMELMIGKGDCGPSARDGIGRTALHHALICGQDECAVYLLGQEPPENPKDQRGESLLIAACKSGCEEAIRLIIQKWPELINDSGMIGQTPLCFACERGRGAIVDILLGVEGLDPNLQAEGWKEWTPLHFAVMANSPDCITSLLDRMDVSVNMEDEGGRTPLALALDNGRVTSAKAILMHKRTSDTVRIDSLDRFCAGPASSFHDIFADVFKEVNPESLTTDEAVRFVEAITRFANEAMFDEAYFERVIECGSWKQTKLPCLVAARMGRFDMVEKLVASGADPTEVDEDHWSCADYAARFGHGQSAVDRMSELISKHQMPGAKPDYSVPTIFEIPESLQENIAAGLCDTEGHLGCRALSSYHVTRCHPAMYYACLQTRSCIPPPGLSTKNYFYFEVTIQEDSKSRTIGLGYCGENVPEGSFPGCFQGSWAYHGDDGNLFVETGRGSTPSRDFGDAGAYSAGDVVGVGLNLETGEGFCTLNGERRDVGTAFEEKKFNIGKFYPCVGFDVDDDGVGLRFTVNFGHDERHPFRYSGPFP